MPRQRRKTHTSHRHIRRASPQRAFAVFVLILAVLPGLALYLITGWPLYWVWMITINLVALAMYGLDKGWAKQGQPRAPEVILHGLALLGGFVGGGLGRWLFRHKTRKMGFAVILILSAAIHLFIAWYFVLR